jgi:hypothetical protein
MKISKTHQRLSDCLEDPRALTNPEDYLGPNWQDVINFWLYLDTLSEIEKIWISDRYCFSCEAYTFSRVATFAASEVVEWEVRDAACDVTDCWVFDVATLELISHHKLLEQNKILGALPLCINP